MARPELVAITGTIGSGKSLVGSLLSKRGFMVIDTDEVVHYLFESDADLQQAIAERFGNDLINPDTGVDRARLGQLVFNDDKARRDLEKLVHPAVHKRCDQLISGYKDERVLFFLVPLLFEANVQGRYDQSWTVIADEAVLKERLRKRTGLPPEEIDKRIATQLPQTEKATRSKHIIDNSGTIEQTDAQIAKLLSPWS